MAVENDYKGADLLITIKVKDSDGDYIDIETLTELFVYIVDKNGVIIAKARKTETAGYTTLVKDDSETYHFYLTSAEKDRASVGIVDIEVMPVETEAELSDEKYNQIGRATLMNLLDSKIKAES